LHGFPDDVRAYDGVAPSLAAAGLDRVEVTYKPLRSVVDPQFAVLQNAPLLHEEAGTNVLAEREFVRGDIEAEMMAAPVRVGGRFRFAAQRDSIFTRPRARRLSLMPGILAAAESQVRTGLAAGGERIRTFGPAKRPSPPWPLNLLQP
jgi:hypothetical protein